VTRTIVESPTIQANAERWFAVQVRCRHEAQVGDALGSKGYQYFLPLYPRVNSHNPRNRDSHAPLFPGYLFCRFDVYRRLPVLTTPGVVRVVGLGNVPVPIDDAEICSIQSICRNKVPTEPCSFMVGERVRIVQGPLSDVEGVILRLKDRLRLVVSVSLLRRSVAIELQPHWVQPVISRAA